MMMSTPLMRFWLDVRSGLISYWSKIPHEELIIDLYRCYTLQKPRPKDLIERPNTLNVSLDRNNNQNLDLL